jgi:hypothetical protein
MHLSLPGRTASACLSWPVPWMRGLRRPGKHSPLSTAGLLSRTPLACPGGQSSGTGVSARRETTIVSTSSDGSPTEKRPDLASPRACSINTTRQTRGLTLSDTLMIANLGESVKSNRFPCSGKPPPHSVLEESRISVLFSAFFIGNQDLALFGILGYNRGGVRPSARSETIQLSVGSGRRRIVLWPDGEWLFICRGSSLPWRTPPVGTAWIGSRQP